MVVLFPAGSVLLRVLPGRLAVWVHKVFQLLAWCVWVAGAAVGVYLVTVVRVPEGGLVSSFLLFSFLSMKRGLFNGVVC